MNRLAQSFGVGLASAAVGVVVGLASVGHAGPTCNKGEVRACPLKNGCGGIQECVDEKWGDCHCGGLPFALGGSECWSDCEGEVGTTVCDPTCHTVIGCGTGTCTTCGEWNVPGVLFCPEGSGDPALCVAGENCNGCDDDQDGKVDNVAGTTDPLVEACNPNQCAVGGTHACVNGNWDTCTGCAGQGVCTVCGGQADFDCSNGVCEGTCQRDEECNQCDDNANGKLDDGLHCPPCSL
ncbi:MAG: hypothetical protein AMXMBFR34_32620 [Myxococcaceae bacterium]